jgi:RRG7 (Required for Respiratory Growth 7) protein
MVFPYHLPGVHSRCFYRSFSQSPSLLELSSFSRRLFKLPTPPPPASVNHNDLQSFLSYAEKTGLPSDSTTYVGTHYEYMVLWRLRCLALNLYRVGGRDDAGIDLVGTWHLPRRENALRVVVQCKALKTKLGPNLVRELEGAYRYSPVGWRTTDKLGILVSPREATKGVRNTISRSSYPLFWITMEQDGVIRQALWNERAEALALGGLGTETRYEVNSGSPAKKEIVLTWEDEELHDMDQVEEELARQEAEWLARWGCENQTEARKFEVLEMLETSVPDLGRIEGERRASGSAEGEKL